MGVAWHSREETAGLIAKMSEINLARIAEAKNAGREIVGTAYRRTRYTSTGEKIQRAEARFDNIAGCLRTPAGGSSRQFVLIVEKNRRALASYLGARNGAADGASRRLYFAEKL